MTNLKKFVYNPYIGYQKCYCFNKKFTNKDFVTFVKKLERKTGLRLMARGKSDILHGFVSMHCPNPPFCAWGNHQIKGDHTSIIVSLYKKNKKPDFRIVKIDDPLLGKSEMEIGSKHTFKRVRVTKLLKRKLQWP